VELEEILLRLYQAKVGALSIPFGNPRHEHEIALFRKYPPPGLGTETEAPGVAYTKSSLRVAFGRLDKGLKAPCLPAEQTATDTSKRYDL
jgi:hypothetical protein